MHKLQSTVLLKSNASNIPFKQLSLEKMDLFHSMEVLFPERQFGTCCGIELLFKRKGGDHRSPGQYLTIHMQ